ncbi:MAG: 4Fe-4S dicluster domain-containing protein [Bryobacteraceae bacterium]
MNRRQLLEKAGKYLVLSGAARAALQAMDGKAAPDAGKYNSAAHWWGMTIDIAKCIGCGNCVRACSQENGVPHGYFRTWVERYSVHDELDGPPRVDSPNGGMDSFPILNDAQGDKSFFVPKLCNHCADSPCVQACPVGATFVSPDGVVLVDRKYCIGCRYCIQACPYGCRYLDPRENVVDKCSLCYHRITKGLTTACCEVCPTGARKLADFKDPNDPVHEFLRENQVAVLKPHLATHSKVFYRDLDGAVK